MVVNLEVSPDMDRDLWCTRLPRTRENIPIESVSRPEEAMVALGGNDGIRWHRFWWH